MNPLSEHLAMHFRYVHTGGNWTVSNFKDVLADVTVEEAHTQLEDLNTIATLTYHIQYFVKVALVVLEGGPLKGNDKESFDHPEMNTQEEWEAFVKDCLEQAERFAKACESKEDSIWWEPFEHSSWGNYFRNINGIIEHTHYHLGQIAVIKKLIRKASPE